MSCLKLTLMFFLAITIAPPSFGLLVQSFNPYSSSILILVDEQTPGRVCSAVAVSRTRLATSGHCIDHAKKIQVVLDSELTAETRISPPEIKAHRVHPKHQPDFPESGIDLGTIDLKTPLPASIQITKIQPQVLKKLSLVNQSQESRILRFGFGERSGKNLRTAVGPLTFLTQTGDQLVFRDEFNTGGDSGGPVWLEQGGERVLIGIHSAVDTQDKTKTYSIALTEQIAEWVLR